MFEAVAFDTHRYVKRLTDCGFSEQQAETLAEEHIALLDANLATKTDLARIEARIAQVEAGMDALRQETRAEIAKVEARIAQVEAGMDALRQETRAEIAKVEAGMDALRRETRAEIAKVEARIAQVEARIVQVEARIAQVDTAVETLRQETRAGIEAAKADLLKWLFGALIAQGGLIVALVKLL